MFRFTDASPRDRRRDLVRDLSESFIYAMMLAIIPPALNSSRSIPPVVGPDLLVGVGSSTGRTQPFATDLVSVPVLALTLPASHHLVPNAT